MLTLLPPPQHDHAFPERFERAFENELDHWLDLCHRKQHGEVVHPIVSGTDCANTVRVTRLAQQVRSRQRSAVPLPPVPPAAQPCTCTWLLAHHRSSSPFIPEFMFVCPPIRPAIARRQGVRVPVWRRSHGPGARLGRERVPQRQGQVHCRHCGAQAEALGGAVQLQGALVR